VVNEINTLPGSFAFYLWEPVGVPFAELLGGLVDEAGLRAAERRSTVYAFESSLLAGAPSAGGAGLVP
jgi:D-alanine-D-alanine ligase